jgi:hypothetical protein
MTLDSRTSDRAHREWTVAGRVIALAIGSPDFHSTLRRQRRASPMCGFPPEFRAPYASFPPDADEHHQSALGADSCQPFGPDTRDRVHGRCRRESQGEARWRPGQSTRKRTGTCPCSPLRRLAWTSSRFGYSRCSSSIAWQKPSMPSSFAGSLPPLITWSWVPCEAFIFPVTGGGMALVHGRRWVRPRVVDYGWYSTMVTASSESSSAMMAEMIDQSPPARPAPILGRPIRLPG